MVSRIGQSVPPKSRRIPKKFSESVNLPDRPPIDVMFFLKKHQNVGIFASIRNATHQLLRGNVKYYYKIKRMSWKTTGDRKQFVYTGATFRRCAKLQIYLLAPNRSCPHSVVNFTISSCLGVSHLTPSPPHILLTIIAPPIHKVQYHSHYTAVHLDTQLFKLAEFQIFV